MCYEQEEMFGDAAWEAHARKDDPETSHQAAASITPDKLSASQHAVYDAFGVTAQMSDEGLRALYKKERSKDWPQYEWPAQSDSGIRTRRSELVRCGLLKDSGLRIKTVTGRQTIVWERT